ncbi:MAG: RNA polymerase sigma factor region1.1 domain-containing protein, partial [Pseudomonadota bacterium]
MATKTANAAEETETTEETTDGPLMDGVAAAIKKMVAKGKERGYVTYDDLNDALPSDKVSSEQIEDTMALLSEMGVNVIENEENEDNAANDDKGDSEVRSGNVDDEDIGRTDDPVRMYLREMGSVELLSREGEIAIAKRIEAGREMMIGGICESPLTIKAIVHWREALVAEKILLRDIIDLDATYGGGPGEDNSAPSGDESENGEENGALAEMPADAAIGAPNGASHSASQAPNGVAPNGAANGAANGAGANGAAAAGETGEDGEPALDENGNPIQAEDGDDADEEDNSISLAAMERALLPDVLENFEKISQTYAKLHKAQEERFEILQGGGEVPKPVEKKYEKAKSELVELMKTVHLNNNRIEQLVDQLYGMNRRLMKLEGRLLRLAESSRISRVSFLQNYQGSELDPAWLERVSGLGKNWTRLKDIHSDTINTIRDDIANVS